MMHLELITRVAGWLAALVAAITGMAMLYDSSTRPADTTRQGWLRHVLRLIALIGITASAALICATPGMRSASFYEVVLRCFLAGYMAMQSPCPWWRYVFRGHGLGSHFIERRRGIR